MELAVETSAAASTAGDAAPDTLDEVTARIGSQSQPTLMDSKRKLDLSQPICGQNKRSKVDAVCQKGDHGAESSSNKDGSPGQENKAPIRNRMQPPPPVPGAKPRGEYAKMSAPDAAKMLIACRQELQQGRQEIQRQNPLLSLQDLSTRQADRRHLLRPEVAECLVGCNLPLTDVVEQLLQIYVSACPDSTVTGPSIRNCIIELATRKSLAPGGGAESVDALEDGDPAHLWLWELRDLKTLPKSARTDATARKKRVKQVADRLAALEQATQQLQAVAEGKPATAKLGRVMAKLDKMESLAWMDTPTLPCTPSQAPVSTPDASGTPAAATQPLQAERAETTAAKEARKADKAAASARKKAEKEEAAAGKLRERQAAAEERERAKQEKQADKEVQQKEKEAARESKAKQKEVKGFGSSKAMQKSRSAFNSFFAKTPGRASTPSSSTSSEPQQGTPAPARLPYHDRFPPPQPGDMMRVLLKEPARNSAQFQQQLQDPPSEQLLQQEQAAWRKQWRATKRHTREWGLPPTWARKQGAEEMVQKLRQANQGGVDMRLFRWKFLYFPADSHRPPSYGSFSKISSKATARNPWGRDEVLDYEVMSDQEWEEEPEGESLSDEEQEEEGEALQGEDSEGEGFVVDDHYLSDDEGVQSAQMKLDDMCADLKDEVISDAHVDNAQAARMAAEAARFQKLEEALEKARKAERMIIISSLEHAPSDASSQTIAHLTGDPALLSALSAQVLLPGEQLTMPEDPFTEAVPNTDTAEVAEVAIPVAKTATAAAAAAAAAGGSKGGGRGRPAGQWPEEQTPALVAWLQAHPHVHALDKAVQGYLDDLGSEGSKVAKKHVREKIKSTARASPGGWIFTAPTEGAASPAQPEEAAATEIVKPSQKAVASLQPALAHTKPGPDTSAGFAAPSAHATVTIKSLFAKTPANQLTSAAKRQKVMQPTPKALVDLMEAEKSPAQISCSSSEAVYPANAADPFWQSLISSIQSMAAGAAVEQDLSQLFRLFQQPHLPIVISRTPHYLITVLATTCASKEASARLRMKCAQALSSIIELLKARSRQQLPAKSTLQRMDSHELTHPPVVSLLGMYANARLHTCAANFAAAATPGSEQESAAKLIGALLDTRVQQPLPAAQSTPSPTASAEAAAKPQDAELAALLSGCKVALTGSASFVRALADWLAADTQMEGSQNTQVTAFAEIILHGILSDDAAARKLLEMDDDIIQSIVAGLQRPQESDERSHPCCILLKRAFANDGSQRFDRYACQL